MSLLICVRIEFSKKDFLNIYRLENDTDVLKVPFFVF